MSKDPLKTHRLDQSTGALGDFAHTLAAYRRSLIAEGFSPAEALQIVLEYQKGIIQSLSKEDLK